MLQRAVAGLLLLALTPLAAADPGDPVAIRWWGGGHVTIETWWNLVIAIDPPPTSDSRRKDDSPAPTPDLVVLTHGPAAAPGVALRPGRNILAAITETGQHQAVAGVLDRPADTATVTFVPPGAGGSPNAVSIRSIPAERDEKFGDEQGRTAMLLIEVDGLRILHAGGLRQSALRREQLAAIGGGAEVLLIPTGPCGLDSLNAARVLRQLGPRIVIPIGAREDGPGDQPLEATSIAQFLRSHFATRRGHGNTLAVRELPPNVAVQPALVSLAPRARRLPPELETLLAGKEAAARRAADALAPLSVKRLDQRAADGEPSVREAAAAASDRELTLMSAIFARVDPDLPARPTPASGAEWTGAEEARRIGRVQAFTRRFSSLLVGLDLDTVPAGAPAGTGSLRATLEALTGGYDGLAGH